jgi:hypothetical protein
VHVTAEIVDYLRQVLDAGGIVEGAADPSLEQLRLRGAMTRHSGSGWRRHAAQT